MPQAVERTSLKARALSASGPLKKDLERFLEDKIGSILSFFLVRPSLSGLPCLALGTRPLLSPDGRRLDGKPLGAPCQVHLESQMLIAAVGRWFGSDGQVA